MNKKHFSLTYSFIILLKKQTIYGYGNKIEHEGQIATDPDTSKGSGSYHDQYYMFFVKRSYIIKHFWETLN